MAEAPTTSTMRVRRKRSAAEKLQIVEAEKKKIRQEFERKEKQVEVRRKM